MTTVVKIIPRQAQLKCRLGDTKVDLGIIALISFSVENHGGFPSLLISGAVFEGFIEFIDEQLVIERLAQEGDRTCPQGQFTHTDLVMGGDEDDRKRVVTTD
jgi:hypothetical protein